MAPSEALDPGVAEREAEELLEAIDEAKERLEGLPGLLNGELDRFRARIDRLLREAEVNNWRQVRIFLRDLDAIAVDLAEAAKKKRLAAKHVTILDLSLRKARKRDFYGARKAWRKLDKIVGQTEEVRRLRAEYRDRYRTVEARIRHLKAEMERLRGVPKPPASISESSTFVADVDTFNAAAEAAFLDFLARERADVAIPILLEVAQGGGIGVPAPPRGSDPDPLLHHLSNPDPGRDAFRSKSFYGLLELPGYSDAKLAHVMGDSRLVRKVLEAAWPWLKIIRDQGARSLHIQWTEDPQVLRRRLPGLVDFLRRVSPESDALARGEQLANALASGRFEALQTAARLYATYGRDAERKWTGELEDDVSTMAAEVKALGAVLAKLSEPSKIEASQPA